MIDLKTNYLGLKLKNPIILGASNLVNNLDNVKRAEDKGIAAIVYKSLFEEQMAPVYKGCPNRHHSILHRSFSS